MIAASAKTASAHIKEIRSPGLEPILFDFYTSTVGSPTVYDFQGFNSFGGATPTVANGKLNLDIFYDDPQFKSVDNMNIDASVYKYVKIKMKNGTAGTTSSLFFITTADASWDGTKMKVVNVRAQDPNYTEYLFDMSTVAAWTGTIRQLRIDPEDGASSGTVSIDSIGVYPDSTTEDVEFDFMDGSLDGFNDFQGVTVSSANSFLNLSMTNADPNIKTIDHLNLSTAAYKYVKVRMRNGTSATTGTLYFITNTDTTWNDSKSVHFTLTANDPDYTDYIVDMSGNGEWTGTLRQIRIDPQNGASSGTSSLDLVGIYTGSIVADVAYEFTSSADGWTAVSDASVLASGGSLTMANAGTSPEIASPDNVNLNAGEYKYVKIRLKNNTSSNIAQLYWTTTADTTFDEQKSQKFIVKENDAGYTEYVIGLSQNPYWSGTIKQLRLKPSRHQASGSTNIDYVVITQSADTSRQNWEVREGWLILNPLHGWEFQENGGQFIGHVSDKTKWWNFERNFNEMVGQGFGLSSDFISDTQGWSAASSSTLNVSGGALHFNITGSDPYMMSSDNLGIDAQSARYVQFNIKNNTPDTVGKIYFITDSDPVWDESKSVTVTISANDGGSKEYNVDMGANAGWTGTIKRIRWDVVNTVSSGSVDIDWFYLRFDYEAYVIDNKTDASVSARRTIAEQTSGVLKWEFKIAFDASPANGIEWALADGMGGVSGDNAIKFVTSGGNLNYVNTDGSMTSIQAIAPRKDYRVLVMVNMDTRQYDIWVDGVSKATNRPFLNGKVKINKAYVGTTDAATTKMLLRMRLYKIGYVYDEFASEPVGAAPIGYSAEGTVPSGSSLTIRRPTANWGNGFTSTSGVDMHKGSGSGSYKVYKNFTAATGVIEYQMDFILPVKMDHVSFSIGNGGTDAVVIKTAGGANGSLYYVDSAGVEQKLWDNYKANVSYTFVVEANIMTDTATIYVNGIRCATDVPFRNAVTQIDKLSLTVPSEGHLIFNYVRVASYYPSTVPYVDAVNNPSSGYVGMQGWQYFSSVYETWDRTQAKLKQSDKTPYLGFIDEYTPESIDWQIKYLAEHGIDFISQFSERGRTGVGIIDVPETGHILWLDTYLDRSREFAGKVKFAATIAPTNTMSFSDADEFLNAYLPYLMERYFRNPNYVKFNNKPVLFLYDNGEMATMFGGKANLNTVLDQARSWLATQRDSEGNLLSGAIFVNEYRPGTPSWRVQDIKDSGFDYVYAYAGSDSPATLASWKSTVDATGIGAIASPSNMWDNRYWYYVSWQTMTVPEQFKYTLQYVKDTYWPSYASTSLASKMVFMDNWSEFGEGHSILPTNQYGFKWLDAIRDVFTTAPKQHSDSRPDSTYDALYTKGWKTELLRNFDLEQGTAYWTPALANISTVPHTEAPFNYGDYDRYGIGVTHRWTDSSDVSQDVTAEALKRGNGKIYDISAYVRTASGTGRKNALVYVMTNDDAGDHWFVINGKADDTIWTKVSGEIMLTWTGKLNYAKFYVRGNADDTGDFYVDDVSMRTIR